MVLNPYDKIFTISSVLLKKCIDSTKRLKGIMIMGKKDEQQIKRYFAVKRKRQLIAVAAAIGILLLLALVYRRPDIFGEFSKRSLVIAQILVILGFVNFTAFNWICPSCKKYMGSDLNRSVCKRCGAKLR